MVIAKVVSSCNYISSENSKNNYNITITACTRIELGFTALSHTFMVISSRDRNPGPGHNALLFTTDPKFVPGETVMIIIIIIKIKK